MTYDDEVKGLPESPAAWPSNPATNPIAQAMGGGVQPSQFFTKRRWLWALLLMVATLIAYQPAWRAGFIWDDDFYVTSNPLLTTPDGLKRIWFTAHPHSQFCPLVTTTFRFEHQLWGFNATGYHVFNVLLHGINALMVWTVLRRLAVPGAWLGAAFFALHPVQVESVAWITELKNTQSTFFYLLALLSWMRFAEGQTPRPWRFYVLALFLHAAALFSKTTACTLPAAMVLVLWLQHKPIGWRRIAQVVPFLILGVGTGLAAVWWERYLGNYLMDVGQSFSGVDRLLIATRALWFYAAKLVWPMKLTFSYPRWDINALDPIQYVWLIACVALALLLWLRRGIFGRGPIVAVVFFVAALSPLLGFIPVYTFRYSFVADHYQYVASMGPLALAAAGITTAFHSIEKRKPLLKPMFCGLLLLVLGALTWRQSATYSNVQTLWQTTIERNPGSYLAHNNLGNILFKKGRVDGAIAHYFKALAIKPDYAETHYNLGTALMQQGHFDEAIAHLQEAAQPRPDSQKVQAMAWETLGGLLLQQGREDEAIADYQSALRLDPGLASARSGLGNVLLGRGRVAEAIANYEAAIRLEPDNPATLNNLGWLLATCSGPSLRDGVKAVGLAGRACELTGYKQAVFIGTLAAAYAEAGQFKRAMDTAQRASDLALSLGQTNLFERNQKLLQKFGKSEPWREPYR